MKRPSAVFDKNMAPNEFGVILEGWNLLSAAASRPRTPYAGPYLDDEDHHDVLQLAWENDALVVTADGAMIGKAWEFGRCGSKGHRLNGVVVLPPKVGEQTDLFARLVNGDLVVHNIDPSDGVLNAICTNNLGVDLRERQPKAVELCDCPWDHEVERRRKRYKRK